MTMKAQTRTVWLFEDEEQKGEALKTQIHKFLPSGIDVQRFPLQTKPDGRGAYEDLVAVALEHAPDVCLIVSDRDISTSKRFPGLSEAVVTKAAATVGLPICVYASGKGTKEDAVLERSRSGGDGRIVLDPSDFAVMGEQVSTIAQGMLEVEEHVLSISRNKRKPLRGAAAVVASILDAPEAEEHLSLYVRGDQRMVAELLPARSKAQLKAESGALDARGLRRISTVLGTWFYDSVLRFPGLILDRVAAGSFLGIDPDELLTKTVQRALANAVYAGPFHSSRDIRWWRSRLADLVGSSAVESGREAIRKSIGRTPKPCRCSFVTKEPHLPRPSGFTCVVTHAPVCEAHSVGQISWLPRGADLARVRRDIYEQLSPWIGM